MRKKLWICTAIFSCLLLTGCQETPKEDVIVPKQDVEKQLEENTELPESGSTLREYLEAPETVDLLLTAVGNQEFNAEGVTITIPETSGLPSAKMSRYTFDETYLEKASKYFFKDADIYKYEQPVMTKSDYQSAIENAQKLVDDLKAGGAREEIVADYDDIDELLNSMASAPDTWEPENEPIEYVFNSNGSFHAKSEADGISSSLVVTSTDFLSYITYYSDDPDAIYGDFSVEDETLKVQEGASNRCRYTREEAVALCEAIINELIPDDNFVLESIYDQYNDNARWETGGTYTITEFYGYSLNFTRQINDVKETRTTFAGIDAEGAAEGYMPFGYESLSFHVTDKGVISFSWHNCMKLEEIAYNNVSVLSFPQIKAVIETNFPLKYADFEIGDGTPFILDITEISLGLMCLRNKNDNSSFTMIPVWDVFSNDDDPLSFCINAIDGSVVDRGLRY